MLVIVSYDIEKNRTRTRLAKKLKDFGPRVQKSVFEADITEDEMSKLFELLEKVQLEENDSIRLYRICAGCQKNINIWGIGEITEDKDFYIS